MKCGWLGVVWVAACARNIPQDRSTGPDGKMDGALPISLDHGAAKVRGIVTYPGGDRVDWKVIEVPAAEYGVLDLQMSWTTPRPGLALAFDVFDERNVPVVRARRGDGAAHTRSASIGGARGRYFVRVYAPRRMDAGAYVLHATFTEPSICGFPSGPKLEWDDPPPLPAVPTDDDVAPDPAVAPPTTPAPLSP